MTDRPSAHEPQPGDQHDFHCGEARLNFRTKSKLRWPVEFEIVERGTRDRSAAPPRRHRGTTHGIGIGGTFVTTDLRPEVGSSVRLWLFVPNVDDESDATMIPLHGEVRWSSDVHDNTNEGGFGVAFRALTARDEVQLHAHFSRFETL